MYTYTYVYIHTHIHACTYTEKAMAPHSSTLAWEIPWTEEPGGLQSMGPLRVGHNWATSLSLFTFMHWRRKWQPTPYSCLENPRDRGAWWAAVYGVAQSRTQMKWLSSSSRNKRKSWGQNAEFLIPSSKLFQLCPVAYSLEPKFFMINIIPSVSSL